MTFLKSRAVPVALLALAAMALGSCTVKKTEQPALGRPVGNRAVARHQRDARHPRPGRASQAVLEMVTRGPDGRPVGSVPLRVEIRVGGARPSTSAGCRTGPPVTGSDGIARVTYTAPPAPPEPVDTFIDGAAGRSRPVSGDFHGVSERYVDCAWCRAA